MKVFSAALCIASWLATARAASSTYLTATALVTNHDHHSALECWIFESPFDVSTDAGTAGSASYVFNHTEDVSYSVIPPRFNGGTHNAPKNQIVVFMSGMAHITLPVNVTGNSTLEEVWFMGGANGLLIATDTYGSGHITDYPSDQNTITLQIPLSELPDYKTLYEGPCFYDDNDGQEDSYLLTSSS